MGASTTVLNPIATRFASLLAEHINASRVLLFGSQVNGGVGPHSDYDFIIVSSSFEGVRPLRRPVGLRRYWREAGGSGPMDLFCLTPAEFAEGQTRATVLKGVLPTAVDLL